MPGGVPQQRHPYVFEDMGIVAGWRTPVVLEVTDAVMFADILRQLMDGRFLLAAYHHP